MFKFRFRSTLSLCTLFLVCVLVLAGCGSAETANHETGSGSGQTTENNGSAGNGNASEGSSENETRIYKTAKGDITIPAHPQRIVTDYYGGEILSVGGNLIGVEPSAFENPFIKEQLKNTTDVGYPVNVEKTLELQPDLIVVMYDDNYEELSKIAPTVHIPYGTATDIYKTVELFGDLIGEKEQAEAFIAAYEKKAEEGREKLKGIVDENTTVGLYELTDKGDLWTFGDNAGRGGQAVYNALKLKMPSKISNDNQTVQLSLEVLPEYAADYMFMTVYDPEKKGDALKEFKQSKVWNGLEAVKNQRFFENDFDTFYRYDPIAITAQIDLFVDLITKSAQANN
ncbi:MULTISPECIES: iron-hydroxamate ABC transporter substrate-binding protein [Paenibacillus]|uniref:Iron-hydroxamate ABC transporter substrate-binding protein n=1 Tax=Paenibacillus xylanilyticus TaxID=248903 RepID=A0A7Y6EWZ8_9BACL|nr:iron-hydroxamate ABC transporter substrate-binding protein [Paenibacillus xylanilyticus]NUU78311.1 iron-hydroxamate ABC transporter substrate-binding protein [Paenibacillus xylanilyticus]